MGTVQALPYPSPRKSRYTVTSVDNQGLKPLHEPLQTVTQGRHNAEDGPGKEGGAGNPAHWLKGHV